jgi:hypothetical protein
MPVCSFPAIPVPMISPGRLSSAVWMFVHAGVDGRDVRRPFLQYPIEAALDLGNLVLGEDAQVFIGTRPGNRTGNILGVEDTVIWEGFVIRHHQKIKAAFAEPSIRVYGERRWKKAASYR